MWNTRNTNRNRNYLSDTRINRHEISINLIYCLPIWEAMLSYIYLKEDSGMILPIKESVIFDERFHGMEVYCPVDEESNIKDVN